MNHTSQVKRLLRTQVMLTPELIGKIDSARLRKRESRSAYLRKAALLRLIQEEKQREDLTKLADTLIGSISLKDHPVWKDASSIEKWKKDIRNEWE